ncbi:MAG: oxidoreductase [Candidatus Thiodiazotropha sp.]
MTSYKAFRIHRDKAQHSAGIEELELQAPDQGEIQIRVQYSSINYKDALAGTGKAQILRRYPLTGGIDACGEVTESNHKQFKPGDSVIVTGHELSSTADGGYAEYLRVPGEWAVPLPDGLSASQAMALGTAGFTAALALHRMEMNGQRPDMGPMLVTGASGGVGCFAVNIFDGEGFEVHAVTGKSDQQAYLEHLGAQEVLGREQVSTYHHALERGLWGGAVDNVGGDMLSSITRKIRPWGSIATIGLAGGHELNTTVMPFILRGVSLLGVDSAGCPREIREEIWQRLATDLKPRHLDDILTQTVSMEQLPEVFDQMLAGKTLGRTLVTL